MIGVFHGKFSQFNIVDLLWVCVRNFGAMRVLTTINLKYRFCYGELEVRVFWIYHSLITPAFWFRNLFKKIVMGPFVQTIC